MTNRLAPAVVLLLLAACSPGASRAPAVSPAPASVPVVAPDTVDSGPELQTRELRDESSSLLGNVRYDMPMEANTWVATELDFLVNQRKAVVARWLERGEKYQEFVKGVFAGYGLPTDMHHLAMVESGFIPTARSHAGAVGMWQFMPATGRGMGLRIDDLVDERMDPVRSTHAAARHLRDLHRAFGSDWSLAAAAYNAGAGRISRGMQGIGAKNFWELAVWGTLAQETKRYVPRLYAVTIIARDRERFGFPRPRGLVNPFAYDSIRTDLSIPLAELARMANLPATALAELNPHLHRGVTPGGDYWVWVPRGTGAALQQAYLDSEFRRDGGYGTYAVRRGDSAEKLALYAGMTISRIRELNPSVDLEKLPAGVRLRLPRPAANTLASRPVERVASRSSDRDEKKGRDRAGEERGKGDRGSEPRRSASSERSASRDRERASEGPSSGKPAERGSSSASERRGEGRTTEHRVSGGETLWGLAREHGVSVDEIREANDLKGDVIVPGRTLRIPRRAEREASSTSSREHVVRSGETLWGIARMYDSTVDALQEANELGEDSPIRPGQKLRIPR